MTKAIIESRTARCIELAMKGTPYSEIARAVGYKNKSSAWRLVNDALTERVDEAVEVYRATELARLDSLQSSLWDQAMEGDLAACNAVLRIVDRRIRLLRLDQQETRSESSRTIVLNPADLVSSGE